MLKMLHTFYNVNFLVAKTPIRFGCVQKRFNVLKASIFSPFCKVLIKENGSGAVDQRKISIIQNSVRV